MTEKRLKFGKEGEAAAVKFLKKRGYRILEKNFRSQVGEIDIIAEHDKVVVFVEVKTRTNEEYGHPVTALTPTKQKKIARTAQSFLARHKIDNRETRFDVVAITGLPDNPKQWNVELFEDAFRM